MPEAAAAAVAATTEPGICETEGCGREVKKKSPHTLCRNCRHKTLPSYAAYKAKQRQDYQKAAAEGRKVGGSIMQSAGRIMHQRITH